LRFETKAVRDLELSVANYTNALAKPNQKKLVRASAQSWKNSVCSWQPPTHTVRLSREMKAPVDPWSAANLSRIIYQEPAYTPVAKRDNPAITWLQK